MIQTKYNTPIYQEDSPFQRQWSIRQANSRMQAFGQNALKQDLSRKLQDEEKTGLAIPLSPLRDSQLTNTTNPYLSSSPMMQQPSKSPTAHRGGGLKHKTYGFQDPFAVAPMEAWQEIKDYNLRVNGLPTLDQMMRLNTYSPLTQSNFTAFLKRHGVHQHLNFLMELETHDKLWRAYLQSLDRQNRQRLSRFLESAAEKDPDMMHHHHGNGSLLSFQEVPDTDDLLSPLPPQPLTPKFQATDVYASRGNKSLSHEDLVHNATRIYRTYCSPVMDAAQLIYLPDDYRRALEELIEVNQRPEPIVFDSARAHVFEILNVFYYPLFVDDVLNKNVSLATSRVFLVVGFILMTLACSVELSLIFLDSGGFSSRWIPIAPFFVGWSFLLASIIEFAWFFGILSLR